MQGKFKWAVFIILCLTLFYLAWTNRYIIYPLRLEELTGWKLLDPKSPPFTYYKFYIYDRWTGKLDSKISRIDSEVLAREERDVSDIRELMNADEMLKLKKLLEHSKK